MPGFASISSQAKTSSQSADSKISSVTLLTEPDTHEVVLQSLPVQRKLSFGAPNDPFEREADTIAGKVMRMPEQNFIQRKCADCEKEERLQRKPLASFIQRKESTSGAVASDALSTQINTSKGNGSSMDYSEQNFMQSRFGADFSDVKIHTGGKAAQMNRDLNAKAFTVGNDIYFNEGQYNPNSNDGKHLLAHELTHTIQQGGQNTVQSKLIQRDEEEDRAVLREAPPVHLANPFIPEEEENRAFDEYLEQRDAYEERLRNAVLAPVERPGRADGTTFLNRLRSLNSTQAVFLANDDTFFTRVRRLFSGKSLWTVFTILYFNNRLQEPFLRLNYAVMNNDARLLTDMISIVVVTHHSDRYFAFLREVCQTIFRGDPLLAEILRLIDHRGDAGISQRIDSSYTEVHYERNAAGTYALRRFSGPVSANVYFSGNEVRMIVRMRFVDGSNTTACPTANAPACSTFYLMGEYSSKYSEWQSAIQRYWNNKFSITNGLTTYNVTFVPLFMSEADSEAVNIRIMADNTSRCSATMEPGRSFQTCWFINNLEDGDIAHEFGHMIGASDEYRLPGSYQELTNAGFVLAPEDSMLTTYEGIMGTARPAATSGYGMENSLMNDSRSNVFPRHLTRLIRIINNGIASGMPPFSVRSIH